MRIVHVRSNFDVALGYDTLEFPLQQKKLGHDVIVVTSDKASSVARSLKALPEEDRKRLFSPQETIKGIPVYRLSHKPGYDDLTLVNGLKDVLSRLEPDIVHCNSAREGMPAQAAKCKSVLDFKFFTREDQYDFPADKFWKKAVVVADFFLVRKWICNYAYRRAEKVFSTCQAGVEFLKKHHGLSDEKTGLLLPCLNTDLFSYSENERERVRKKLGLNETDFLLVTAGKVSALKRFDVYLNALKLLKQKGISVKLLSIGSGNKRYINRIKRAGEKSGVELGFVSSVPQDELSAYYSAADAGVWNRSTLSIQESMACGLPVIISDYAKNTIHQFEGEIFKTNDHFSLAGCIQELYLNRQRRKELARLGVKAVREHFDIRRQAKELVKTYEQYLKR